VFGGSALTADIDVPKGARGGHGPRGIPITYVPARNTIFLSFALALGRDARRRADIFVGLNGHYSGYPDCRRSTSEALRADANLAKRAGVEARSDCRSMRR